MKISPILVLCTISAFGILSCWNQSKNDAQEFIEGSNIDLNPLMLTLTKSFDSLSSSPKNLTSLSDKIPTTREELFDMQTVVKIYKGDKSAGMSVPGFGGLTLGSKESSLHIYFVETLPVISGTDTVVYGVGYSFNYLFRKVKKGIEITSLSKVAASAQLQSEKTSVLYSTNSFGVRSLDLVKFFKPVVNANYDVDGFGIIQSNLDGIHNVFSDSLLSKRVIFSPQPLGFIRAKDILGGN